VITLWPSSTAVNIPLLLTVATPGFCETQAAEPALSTVAPSENATKALSCAVSPFLLNSKLPDPESPETRNVIGVGPVAGVTGVASEEEELLQPNAANARKIPRMLCFKISGPSHGSKRRAVGAPLPLVRLYKPVLAQPAIESTRKHTVFSTGSRLCCTTPVLMSRISRAS